MDTAGIYHANGRDTDFIPKKESIGYDNDSTIHVTCFEVSGYHRHIISMSVSCIFQHPRIFIEILNWKQHFLSSNHLTMLFSFLSIIYMMLMIVVESAFRRLWRNMMNYSNPAGLLFYLGRLYQSLVRAMKRQMTGN